MEPNLVLWLIVAAAILLVGGVVMFNIARKQEKATMDNDITRFRTRKPVIANPIFWSYILFAVLTFLAAAYYFGVFDTASYSYAHPKGAILHA